MTDIETTVVEAVALGLIGLGAYLLLLRRAADVVQPYRLRMAALGERILAGNPSRERADQIEFYLDNAFSGWVMVLASALFPFAAAWGLLKYATGRFELSSESNKEDDKVMLLFSASVFAANPIFGLVFAAEMLVLAFLVLVLSGPPALMAALDEFTRLEMAVLRRRIESAAIA